MTTFLHPVIKHLSCAKHNKSHQFTREEKVSGELIAPESKKTDHHRSEPAAL
jgi:hypothetical protein